MAETDTVTGIAGYRLKLILRSWLPAYAGWSKFILEADHAL